MHIIVISFLLNSKENCKKTTKFLLLQKGEMMTSKLGSLFLIISVVTLIALTGCERVQDVVMDSMPPEDITMEVTPVKLVWLIDYPEGGKDAYIAWVASIAATLQAPDEITRIRSYDNQDQTYESESAC